ncbi:hypothetical protein [Bacillus suaedaesalsae]|uniref:Uncharacterized protein n=1 Tax=Bacillus suaedaesalsae TaxID=2810349 RepID=A0ABS2DLJ7_9BACI|nr:hypothetical protein [Bacillus suaedaesalsae]MBM6619291.1 hypothetical protein [Bacillus suaedaesalsae]
MWASLLGLVISIAAWGSKKNGNQVTQQNPLQNVMENLQNIPTANLLKSISTTEFSGELHPLKDPLSDE